MCAPWKPPVVVAVVLAAGCSSGPSVPSDRSYVSALSAARADKDQQFRESSESPVPPDKRDALLPLRYFAVDPTYNVPAALTLADRRPVYEIPTSTGTLRRMQLVGTLEFTLGGQAHTLGAFVPDGTQEITELFIPFADATTGTATYSAGRYLDLHPTVTGFYMIDFNRAYNPYCAYNLSYECPFPPPSNRLKIAIQAGERAPPA